MAHPRVSTQVLGGGARWRTGFAVELGRGDERAFAAVRSELGAGAVARRAEGALASTGEVHATQGLLVVVDGGVRGAADDAATAEQIAQRYAGDARGFRLDGLGAELAFAIWDAREGRLVVGCDAVGTRPVAYAVVPGAVIAATRVLPLLRDPRVARAWDEAYLADRICDLRVAAPGATPFAAIRRVPPGFAVVVEGGRVVAMRRVDALEPVRGADGDDAPRALRDAIRDAVRMRAARVRMRGGAVAVSLSGGLDSTTIASALVAEGVAVDAFTARGLGDADLARARRFIAAHPTIRAHEVPTAATWPAWPDDDALPPTDDPIVAGPAALPAKLAIARAAHAAGHAVLFDGDGGDELFDVAVSLGDFIDARDFVGLARVLARMEARRARAVGFRALVVPRLPAPLLRAWLAREERRIAPIPPWTRDAFRTAEGTRAAIARAYRRPFRNGREALDAVLASASNVGAREALVTIRQHAGVDSVSPLFDRRVVELAAGAPPRLCIDGRASKALLREAARGLVPDDVCDAPKDEGAYPALLRRALADREGVATRRRAIERSDVLRQSIDFERLDDALARAARGDALTYRTQERLVALLTLAAWQDKVRARYRLD